MNSVGLFRTPAGAAAANGLAHSWARERLANLGASPLAASDGVVLLHTVF